MIHFVGIAGSFMAGLAKIARELGRDISGSDARFDPPMGDAARALGVPLFTGYDADAEARPAELYVIGNAISRGNPLLESVMRRGLPYVSGPQFLYESALRGRKVLAVAGSHGKTTTTALLAHMLERAGMDPGFLAGGVLPTFGASARLGQGECFVIEADEYDTAFFDKRPKFMHYRPCGVILNNLEFDHADIYANAEEIARQFHYLLRTVPPNGKTVARAESANILRAMEMGAYSPADFFGGDSLAPASDARWRWRLRGKEMEIWDGEKLRCSFPPPLPGAMNRDNILAAVALADWAGAPAEKAGELLRDFAPPLRRLQLLGEADGVKVYDDFAHHPTAYAETIRALREDDDAGRLIAVFEPRSNTMKAGIFRDELAAALAEADVVIGCRCGAEWSLRDALKQLGKRGIVAENPEDALPHIMQAAQAGDRVLLMSNGPFGGLPKRVLEELKKRETSAP